MDHDELRHTRHVAGVGRRRNSSGTTQHNLPTSPLAERVVALTAKPTLSPVVIAGVVRLVEFILVMAVGFAVEWLYLPGTEPRGWAYIITVPCVAAVTVVALQAVDPTTWPPSARRCRRHYASSARGR